MNTIRRAKREWEFENERRLERLSSEIGRLTLTLGAGSFLAASFAAFLFWRVSRWLFRVIGISISILLMDSRLVIKKGPEARSQDLNEVLRGGYHKW